MKLNKARRRYKFWALASTCLALILVCFWLAARYSHRRTSAITGSNQLLERPFFKWGQYEAINQEANKSTELIYYKPEVIYDEKLLKRLKEGSQNFKRQHNSQRYSIQPDSNNVIECRQSAETTLFIVVNSRYDNFHRRDKLRASWLNRLKLESEICSSNETPIKRIVWAFALGQVDDRPDDSRLRDESQHHGDLLMLDLRESYRNLTRKHLAIFEWLLEQRRNYPSSERDLLLKCDDDARLDLGQFTELLSLEGRPAANQRRDVLMCARFQEHSRVLRRESDRLTTKWSLTRQEWPYDTFPSYCSGLVYLANLGLVEKLFLISKLVGDNSQMKTLWIDDVYVTGVLLAAIKLDDFKLVKLNPLFCFTEAQRQHRESLGAHLGCLATEEAD